MLTVESLGIRRSFVTSRCGKHEVLLQVYVLLLQRVMHPLLLALGLAV